MSKPHPNRPKLPGKPRRVRGGVRISAKSGPVTEHWAGRRWMAWVQSHADEATVQEGVEYARLGQTRRIQITGSTVEADVQGRADRPYRVRLRLTQFTDEQWGRVVGALLAHTLHAAKLLSGEMDESIQGLFGSAGLELFPNAEAAAEASCTCASVDPWCKHVCCVGVIVADRLAEDPRVIYALRGLAAEELAERIRHQRAASSAAGRATPVYVPRLTVPEEVNRPLEECGGSFWDAGPDLADLDVPLIRPAVTHPLLRRLGPSPFKGARFPLVGLLATCYDLIGEAALLEGEAPPLGREESD